MLCYFLLAFMISDEKPAVMLKFLNLQIYAFCQNLEISAITSLSTFSAMYSFSSFCYSFTGASQHFFFFYYFLSVVHTGKFSLSCFHFTDSFQSLHSTTEPIN